MSLFSLICSDDVQLPEHPSFLHPQIMLILLIGNLGGPTEIRQVGLRGGGPQFHHLEILS